jgi:hypothetical protein
MESTIMDLAKEGDYDKKKLDKVVASLFSSETKLNRLTYAEAYNYVMPNSVE